MNLYHQVNQEISQLVTKRYTSSFYYGIQLLHSSIRQPIYNIYGFVRYADEIVDTFHHEQAEQLLDEFIEQTWTAIDRKISTNPILHSFQLVYHQYQIEASHVQQFFDSMRMDLSKQHYNQEEYEQYILGSAEVVGLMCLHVFCNANQELYNALKPGAMTLGSAFQKINFLRDLHTDYKNLGRTYFPSVNLDDFSLESKRAIEQEIETEFQESLLAIRQLPKHARFGVYMAWVYYHELLLKIKSSCPQSLLSSRIRINDFKKMLLMFRVKIERWIGKI